MLPAYTLPPEGTPPRMAQLLIEQRVVIQALYELVHRLTPPEAKGGNAKPRLQTRR